MKPDSLGAQIPPEQQRIRDKCFHPSGAFTEFPREDVENSIPARFEKIARMHPARPAVKIAQRSLTYDALNRYANRIARRILEERGFGSEPIALFFEKSIDLVAAILAVLKAGKFYVVLDPSFPSERLHFLLADSHAKLVVADEPNRALASKLLDNQALMTIAIDDRTDSSENLELPISPQAFACIQYTSGSTGTPKGVVLPHRIILQSVRWSAAELRVGIEDRCTLLHSLSFGSGHVNLRLALLNGASVVDFDTKRGTIEQLAAWLKEERITIYHSPASLFRHLAESLPSGGMHPDLRLIRLTGAPVSTRDFELYKTRFGSNTLLRIAMGATEAGSISVCAAILDQSFCYPAEGFPIGYPQRGREIFFLDDDGSPVAPGEIGEIAVKSESLSVGYWNSPSATKDKFLPDPEGGNARIYLTGDLGRKLSDGLVVHLGRKDLTVKIRGFRVDFSEVERALAEHPAIKDAGVRAWEREDGDKYLAAYIVPRPDVQPNVSEIRRFLGGKLPDYMIPTAVQFVEALPLTNGKLNRQGLSKPSRSRPALTEPYVVPRNPTERRLAEIWSEVLQIDDIGLHDNFFDLGGHSLAATRILSRVLDCFRVELSLASFFESPTLDGLALNVEYALRQARRGTNLALVSVPRGNNLPASFGQRALWFHEQLEPGSPAYNLPSVYRLSGELDAQLLERSINQIVARHEVLRTVFATVEGEPVQSVLAMMKIELEVIDLSDPISRAQESEVRRLVGALTERSFDLKRGPLLRPALFKLDRGEHVFFLAVHHIVFDGWSVGIFFRELSQIYNDFRNGKSSSLPELGIQYADFALWQRDRLGEANLRSALDYWKAQLDHLPTTQLPGRRSQRSAHRDSTRREEFGVSAVLLRGLKDLADRSRTTLFMVLLAAWKVALYRYTGQTDIAIGTFVSGRSHPAVEGLIGYFLNLVVLRSDLSGNPAFRELLARVRKVCVDAFAHQDVPFEKLVEELRPARNMSNNPLVQATFAWQNTPNHALKLTGISARPLDISAGIARPFDLHLYIIEEEASLRGYVVYNDHLLEGDAIRGLVGHLKNLLEAIAADGEQKIGALAMLGEVERRRITVEWNQTRRDYPSDKTVQELFESQVEQSPDALALVFEDRRLSSREVNRRANQIAHYLRKIGLGPEGLVGICLERSVEMVVGILAILKAGGAYVPLEPSYPRERLEFMLADTGTTVILTDENALNHLPPTKARVICLDRDWKDLETEAEVNPPRNNDENDAAYVIYTSGSTGQPKGVINVHGGLRNRLQWMQETYRLTAEDCVLQKTPFSFDVSVWEFLWPLISGARLVIARPDGHRDPEYLVRLIQTAGITTVHFVPSMLTVFLQAAGVENCATLRRVFCSGEALPVELKRRFFARSSAALYNLYGPTEASIDVTAWECRRDDDGPIVPIGRPIANTEIYILDPYRAPVPVGVAGDLYIGGVGLARGYLNRAELTAQSFVAHPFSADPRARLYRSGDRARYLANGDIEFLGRADGQVKLRGLRIELGEIEAALGSLAAVEQCAVIVREDTPGDQRLVAYVVAEGQAFETDAVKRFLRTKLPEYIIPAAWVKMSSLPRLPNGKVDRASLPAPQNINPERLAAISAAWTPLERLLAGVWVGLLPRAEFGLEDNFFDLGGHSLLATRIAARLSGVLNTEIPVRFLFEAPTIRDLARRITEQQGTQSRQMKSLLKVELPQTPSREEEPIII